MSTTKALRKFSKQFAVGTDGENLLRALAYVANNQPLSAVGITNGAAALVFKTGASAALAVAGGQLQKLAASTNFPALTGLVIPASTKVHVAFYVDSSGNLGQSWGNQSAAVAGCTFPDVPENTSLLGTALIEIGVGGPFTGGTTALDNAMVTLTYGGAIGPLSPVPYL